MIAITTFTEPFFVFFTEAFGVSEQPDGYFLDTGQSGLFGTITTLPAEVASAARTSEDATIAGHCGHILFLLEFFAAYERGETPTPDWPSSWKTRVVDDAQWQALQHELHTSYTTLTARLQARETWPDEAIGAAMLLLTHCAYHIGEIRQRLLWVSTEEHR